MFHTDLTFIFTILHHSLISKHHFYKMYLFSHTHPQSVYFLMIIFHMNHFRIILFFVVKDFYFHMIPSTWFFFSTIHFYSNVIQFSHESVLLLFLFPPEFIFHSIIFFLHESFPKLIHLLSRFTYFSLDFAHLFTFSDSFFSRSFYFHIIWHYANVIIKIIKKIYDTIRLFPHDSFLLKNDSFHLVLSHLIRIFVYFHVALLTHTS